MGIYAPFSLQIEDEELMAIYAPFTLSVFILFLYPPLSLCSSSSSFSLSFSLSPSLTVSLEHSLLSLPAFCFKDNSDT